MERDLQTAAEIQRSFLPRPLPSVPENNGFAVHAAMLPARAVGGDFYDYFFVGPHRLGLVVGDVLGKGVPASLFMAVSRTLLRSAGDRIEVRFRDNGDGVPASIRERLFTPFFTTKPAGTGTGLGLSISYDIVSRLHRGDLRLETEEGRYAEFIVSLPKEEASSNTP